MVPGSKRLQISSNENTSESTKNIWMKFSMNEFDYTTYAYYDVSGLSIEEQSVINNEITGRLTLI
jgi:hypothetical protein